MYEGDAAFVEIMAKIISERDLASSPSSLLSTLQDLRRSVVQEGQEIFSQWRSLLQLPGRDSAVEPNVGLDARRA
jgi:hypothetical protein